MEHIAQVFIAVLVFCLIVLMTGTPDLLDSIRANIDAQTDLITVQTEELRHSSQIQEPKEKK